MIVDIRSGCVLSIANIFLVYVDGETKKEGGGGDQDPKSLKVTADYL